MGTSIGLVNNNSHQKDNSPLLNSKKTLNLTQKTLKVTLYFSLKKPNFSRLKPLLVTLAKLREFFGSFKSVCDNFFIDLTEFEQIFGASESSFVVWDVDKNGLIDILELFSGLILFSDSKFEDKIRCKQIPKKLIFEPFFSPFRRL